jgi:phosphoglycerate kinase
MKTIQDIKDIKGKTVLLRADFNVPIKNGKIVDPFRIDKTFKTIDALLKKGALLTIVSHLGDDGKESLLPIYTYLKKKKYNISFFAGPINEKTVSIINSERDTDIVLVENLRLNKGEKTNNPLFAKTLSKLGDVYVNDAFSVCHREHASVVGVLKYMKGYAGFQLLDEIKHLSLVFKSTHPFVFILGGNKFSTKLPLLSKFSKKADTLFLGGALLNDVLYAGGFQIGKSLAEKNKKLEKDLQALYTNKKCIIPDDVVVERNGKSIDIPLTEISKTDAIYDVGKQTLTELTTKIKSAKMVLWNGPLGKYTVGYDKASKKLLKALAQLKTQSKAKVIIGGGDTVALVNKMKLEQSFTFVSTGGGATLDFLAQGTLPGIKALK